MLVYVPVLQYILECLEAISFINIEGGSVMQQNVVSQERLQELKGRSKRCVCKYCGGKLGVRLLDFGQAETANMEIFCETCDMIEY